MSDSPLVYLDVRKMARTDPPTVEMLVEPLLPRGTLVAFYAPGGDGKSLTAASLAAAIGHGAEIAGLKCEHGTTLYFDAENGPHEIHRRVHALGLPADYVRVADTSRLDLRRDVGVIEAEVAEQRPDLLVIDSFRSHTPGLDENDTAQTVAKAKRARLRRVEVRGDFTEMEREKLAKSGAALPDGSFPIVTISDLKNAIQAVGRAKDPAAAKAHIKKRAKALGATGLLPDSWRAVNGPERCSTCAGTGRIPGQGLCPNCTGTGRVRRPRGVVGAGKVLPGGQSGVGAGSTGGGAPPSS